MVQAKCIHVLGTGSDVGKSVLVSGLCRILFNDGYRVAPFKAQNMALNSFVTPDGDEIGRAQAVQAMACKLDPDVDMNPVLLKPTSDTGSQVIVHGKPVKDMKVMEYKAYKHEILKKVTSSLDHLRAEYQYVVMEGAGSPAEINLKADDIVNMKMAEHADCPVILVGDIDRGGVFASLVGTLELLDEDERSRVKGFIINKFRGDIELLKDGLDFLEERTGIPVLGVVPWIRDIYIPQEDSVYLEQNYHYREPVSDELVVSVIKLPYLSNYTDFDPLMYEKGVCLRYVEEVSQLKDSDVVIIPGSKNTVSDLNFLRQKGFDSALLEIVNRNDEVLLMGICGGFQMLGESILDVGSSKWVKGLGLLDVRTAMEESKILTQVRATSISDGCDIEGYEIHHGRTEYLGDCKPYSEIVSENATTCSRNEGAISADKKVIGTYIHGLFDSDSYRAYFINELRSKKGLSEIINFNCWNPDKELDKLDVFLREHIEMKKFYEIVGTVS